MFSGNFLGLTNIYWTNTQWFAQKYSLKISQSSNSQLKTFENLYA